MLLPLIIFLVFECPTAKLGSPSWKQHHKWCESWHFLNSAFDQVTGAL